MEICFPTCLCFLLSLDVLKQLFAHLRCLLKVFSDKLDLTGRTLVRENVFAPALLHRSLQRSYLLILESQELTVALHVLFLLEQVPFWPACGKGCLGFFHDPLEFRSIQDERLVFRVHHQKLFSHAFIGRLFCFSSLSEHFCFLLPRSD